MLGAISKSVDNHFHVECVETTTELQYHKDRELNIAGVTNSQTPT